MLNLQSEVWKPIPNFSNYECSNFGNFRNRNKLLKTAPHEKGYRNIRLYRDGKQFTFRAHRLVYMTFVGEIDSQKEINHIDGNKSNNHVSNLECCSHSENLNHAIQTGLLKIKIGKDCKLSKPLLGTHIKTGEQIKFHSQADARRAGFNQGCIQAVLIGLRNHHKNYVWKHA